MGFAEGTHGISQVVNNAHDAARLVNGDKTSLSEWREGSAAGGSGARHDCGFPAITEAECVDGRGYLWDATNLNAPYRVV